MDGFDLIAGCQSFRCYSQFDESQIPNTAALAAASSSPIATSRRPRCRVLVRTLMSPQAHSAASPATTRQKARPRRPIPGGAAHPARCPWRPNPTAAIVKVPACVPDQSGAGRTGQSPVPYVETLMEALTQANLSWKVYFGAPNWKTCDYFAAVIYTGLAKNCVANSTFTADAKNGQLPAVSLVDADELSESAQQDLDDEWRQTTSEP